MTVIRVLTSNNTTLSPSRRQSVATYADVVLRALVVAWILSYYLLPSTMIGRYSPGGLIAGHASAMSFDGDAIVVGIFMILAILGLARKSTRSELLPIWLPFSILMARVYIAVWFEGRGPDGPYGVLSVICAVLTGISAAIIARGTRTLLLGLAFAALVQGGFALAYLHSGTNIVLSGELRRAVGTFSDPNNLYILALVGIPLFFSVALESSNSTLRTLFMIAAATMMATLIVSWYRSAIIASALSLFWLAWKIGCERRVTVALAVVFALLIALTFMKRAQGPINGASANRSTVGHLAIMRDGVELFLRHPIAGVGIGNVSIAVKSPTNVPGVYEQHLLPTPKNLVLYWLCEQGLIGAITLLLLAWSIKRRLTKSDGNLVMLGTSAAWLALLAAGITDCPVGCTSSYVGNCLLGLLIGISAIYNCDAASNRDEQAVPIFE